jgi:hypothetical protein
MTTRIDMWDVYDNEKILMLKKNASSYGIRIYNYQSTTSYGILWLLPYSIVSNMQLYNVIMPNEPMKHCFNLHYDADLLMQHYPHLWHYIPSDLAKIMKPELKKLIMSRSLTQTQLDIIHSYSFTQLKHIVTINYYPILKIKNKKTKLSWVNALIHVKKWGFNTFKICVDLPSDMYLLIQNYI